MPVYLCQSGAGHDEPWRHGIQVYASPFPIRNENPPEGDNRDLVIANWTSGIPGELADDLNPNRDREQHAIHASSNASPPIRRVRHAEVVLVDDICIAYERYWLRLRWPGNKGGFAGYIALGLVGESSANIKAVTPAPGSKELAELRHHSSVDARDDADIDDPLREDTGSTPPSEPFESVNESLICIRTGLEFPSSPALKLMAFYDDGVNPPAAVVPYPTEPVFCRICREGLHEDADDEQPIPEAEADGGGEGGFSRETSSLGAADDTRQDEDDEPTPVDPVRGKETEKGPVQPNPSYHPNADALQNPMLVPCECSGSIAFVHYLCVEQWRCRSRHPDAQHGLHCETCKMPYTLPPPAERPQLATLEQEDWLEAMPPHVMQALRQPHIWWQIGAAIVRRRWLRPLAPIFMSPIVALYCRARRLLKKRGVARRRWTCSLCRRRARWKCVRCLRSYYCSRQCQNVSWHIIHKHVCYKPVRFWWSVVVYGCLTFALFPGILRDPLMYDLGFCLVPISFVIGSVIAGGFATLLKRSAGFDIRGRVLELAVTIFTLWLSALSWGLVRGFFGDTSSCTGFLGGLSVGLDDISSLVLLKYIQRFLLKPAQAYYLMWDNLFANSWFWVRSTVCTGDSEKGCFEHLPYANADFIFKEQGGEHCAADLTIVTWIYSVAAISFGCHAIWKHLDHQRRRQGRRAGRAELHAHQD